MEEIREKCKIDLLKTEGNAIKLVILLMTSASAFCATPAGPKTVSECHAMAYRIDQEKTLGTALQRAQLIEKESVKCVGTGAYDVFLATLYQEAGSFDDADRAARAGLKTANEYRPNLLHGLARSQLGRGKLEDAYKLGLEVTSEFPRYAPVYGLLGAIDSKLKRWDSAYQHGRRLVELDPSADSYLAIATALYQLKRFSEAAAAVNFALDLEPWRIASANGVIEGIYSLIYLNRREEATSLMQRHKQANPNWRKNVHVAKAARELGVAN